MNKKELELLLSQMQEFENPKVKLEQYQTPSDIVADCLWNIYSSKRLGGKTIADLGCGTGIFGIGALLLGARKVHFVEFDKDVLKAAQSNLKKMEKLAGKKFNAEFHNLDVKDFDKKVSLVIQNPPFGVKETHADKLFLIKAMEVSKVVYSFHKLSTRGFIEKFVKENGFEVVSLFKYDFPIKQKFWFHTSRVKKIDVGCWGLKKV
jgi:putative methylase